MVEDEAPRTFRLKDDSVVKITTTTDQGRLDTAYPKRIEVADNGEEIAYLAGKGALIIGARGGRPSASPVAWTIYEFEQTEESGHVVAIIVIAVIKSLMRRPDTDSGEERGGGAPLLAVTMPTIPPMSRDEPPRRRPPEAKS